MNAGGDGFPSAAIHRQLLCYAAESLRSYLEGAHDVGSSVALEPAAVVEGEVDVAAADVGAADVRAADVHRTSAIRMSPDSCRSLVR